MYQLELAQLKRKWWGLDLAHLLPATFDDDDGDTFQDDDGDTSDSLVDDDGSERDAMVVMLSPALGHGYARCGVSSGAA